VRNAIKPIHAKRDASENILALALNVPAAVTAAVQALEDLGDLLSAGCFSNPAELTHDNITRYALALMRVRECAIDAGMTRLTDACDALAVTVSQLIDDETCANERKCEALTRFVVHAQVMIEQSGAAFVLNRMQSLTLDESQSDAYSDYAEKMSSLFRPGHTTGDGGCLHA
jgi:hypothetical protein